MLKKIVLLALLLFAYQSFSDISDALNQVGAMVDSEKRKLSELRDKIDSERIPLSRNIMELTAEIERLREAYRHEKMLANADDGTFAELKEEADQIAEDNRYIVSLMHEYIASLASVRDLSDINRYDIEDDVASVLEDEEDYIPALDNLLKHLYTYNLDKIAGESYEGRVSLRDGTIKSGTFSDLGASLYFQGKDGKDSGMVTLRSEGGILPVLGYDMSTELLLRDDDMVFLPVDLTGGNLIMDKTGEQGILDEIEKGGYVMWPILGLGLLSILTIIYKYFTLHRISVEPDEEVKDIIDTVLAGDEEAAMNKAEALGKPLAPVLMEGIHHRDAGKEDVEEIMHERILFQLPFLSRYMTVLSVSAAAAPLLGLLGTVTGMIHTFDLVRIFGSGETDLLSGGISEALITTKYGLIVAIPALLSHAYFSRKIKMITAGLEQVSISFINNLRIKGICRR
ncbi:MAG: MotA/TolQ/ExbB proton channel family protein [Candidatus Muiribacteriaceae bacterium]